MRRRIRPALIQIMICRLFGTKPLSKPMLGYCQLGTNFSEILIKIRNFLFRKMVLKCRLPKWRPFCSGGDDFPDSKVHGTNMGPTWVLSALDGPHVVPMNLAISVSFSCVGLGILLVRNQCAIYSRAPPDICTWFALCCTRPIYATQALLLLLKCHLSKPEEYG